jgi:hypothetical protein
VKALDLYVINPFDIIGAVKMQSISRKRIKERRRCGIRLLKKLKSINDPFMKKGS